MNREPRQTGQRLHEKAEQILGRSDYTADDYMLALRQAERQIGETTPDSGPMLLHERRLVAGRILTRWVEEHHGETTDYAQYATWLEEAERALGARALAEGRRLPNEAEVKLAAEQLAERGLTLEQGIAAQRPGVGRAIRGAALHKRASQIMAAANGQGEEAYLRAIKEAEAQLGIAY